MISVERSLAYARKHFPEGPEKLAERLGVEVRCSPLLGCDGWCLSAGQRTIIRINSRMVKSRQRFTLAHELGHLLSDVPSVIGESLSDVLRSDDKEEKQVNDIAAELLVPRDVVQATVQDLPVVASVLRRLAKEAQVSELAAALRVANLAADLGLEKASVVFFEDNNVSWQWSKTLTMPRETAVSLREAARNASPNAFRRVRESENDVIVASLIENPFFGSATMFVQLLPIEYGTQKSRDERRAELEKYLFAGQEQFQRQLQGCFGALKPRVTGMCLPEAERVFWERYEKRFAGVPKRRLASPQGREYVRLRLEGWCGR
jgi:Zn-dependent peptidase ImmA (M78 family)